MNGAINRTDMLVRSACLVVLCVLLQGAAAQTASNACSYAAGSQYAVNSSCVFQTFNKPSSFTQAVVATGCSATNNNDAFGWFTATATTTIITYDPDNSHNPIMHIFTGACGSLTQVGCMNANGNGGNESITLTTTIGTNYLVRVHRSGTNNSMDGRLCVYSTPPPPANDDPCGAVALGVGLSCSNTAGTNVAATNTAGIPAPGCAAYNGNDVWFRFVAPVGGAVNIETTAGGMTDSGMALYSATACGGTFTLIECDDDDGPGLMSAIYRTGLTAGATYYIRLWGYNGTSGNFDICVWEPPPPPANDDPCGAIALSLGSACTMASYSNVSATDTPGIPAPGCSTFSGGDVWFKFVAPASRAVTVRTSAGSISNLAMALYSATACNGTFTLMECDNLDGPGNMPFLTFTEVDLVAGQTYYLRVWQNGGGAGTFNLCANTAPVAGTCLYILRLNDSQGDGWGGSTVSVQIGAGAPVPYTLADGDQDVFYIPVNHGDLVQVTYNAVGLGQGEISYFIQQSAGIVYADGPTPGTGLRYANNANCATPPNAPPSDCYGGQTICNAQQIGNNPSNTGLKADLNGANRGCLGSDERQGTWYNFRISAAGTVAFTLAPTNAGDDYDFAIWGPTGALSCPPSGAPFRCNYSYLPGNTGLSTTASNPSEPALGVKWSTAMNVALGDVFVMYISNYSRSGLAFNLTWQLTNGASLDCTLLPVDRIEFDGAAATDHIVLDWSTATEANTDRFTVERLDGTGQYRPIGEVQAAGNSFSTTTYGFIDPSPALGLNYYRLELADMNGSTRYSNTVAVPFRRDMIVGVPYPNPAEDNVYMDLTLATDAELRISIIDASGRSVSDRTSAHPAGAQRIRTSISGLDAGIYQVVVSMPGSATISSGRFLVQ